MLRWCTILFLCLLVFPVSEGYAQFGWVKNKSLGPGMIRDAVEEPDGGLTIVGNVSTDVGRGRPNLTCHPDADGAIWLARLDSNWNIVWEQCYGGSRSDQPVRVFKPTDSTYIVFFWTDSEDGDMSGNTRGREVGALITDQQGNLDTVHFYGGSASEILQSVSTTDDGGYILGIQTNSGDGDVPGHYGQVGGFHYDAWLVKLKESLSIDWTFWWGGTDHETYPRVKPWINGTYAIAVGSASDDNDLLGNIPKARDVWLLQLDSTGNLRWQKKITEGENSDYVYDLIVTTDSNLVLAGQRANYYCDSAGRKANMWVAKVDTAGAVIWEGCYGDLYGSDKIYNILPFSNGYLINATVQDKGGDASNYYGGAIDYWIAQLDGNGVLIWEHVIGGSATDNIIGLFINDDILTGFGNANSLDYDLLGIRDSNDYTSAWLFELALYPVGIEPIPSKGRFNPLSLYPNPTAGILEISLDTIPCGQWQALIYDNMGRMWQIHTLTWDGSSATLDVSGLAAGAYYLQVIHLQNRESYARPFVLTR